MADSTPQADNLIEAARTRKDAGSHGDAGHPSGRGAASFSHERAGHNRAAMAAEFCQRVWVSLMFLSTIIVAINAKLLERAHPLVASTATA